MSLEIVQIIEDEPLHAQLLDRSLRKARYRTNVAGDGVTGLADVQRLNPSLVLLDLLLPGMNGLEVCRRIRDANATRQIPIIMLSALGGEEDRIAGIEMGADDYLTKPFSPREVVSRVGSLLRRTRLRLNEGFATDDDALSIEEHCLKITLFGKRLTVSQSEWRLLHLLTKRLGQIVSVEELAGLIWTDGKFLRYRDLDTMIDTLNTKLSNTFSGSIEIVPTIGYRFLPPRATA
jgi:Response regulators consisting of a CheY-like receiver domain and a winged-helix DNA-binding domain